MEEKDDGEFSFDDTAFAEFCSQLEISLTSRNLPKKTRQLPCVMCQSLPTLYCVNCTSSFCDSCRAAVHDNSPIPIMRGHAFLEDAPETLYWEGGKLKEAHNKEENVLISVEYSRVNKKATVILDTPHENWVRFGRTAKISDESRAVVSFMGPSNVGKSFLISSLMGESSSDDWPAVAADGAGVATSSHVSKYNGCIFYKGEREPLTVVDLEGIGAMDLPITYFRKFVLPDAILNDLKARRLQVVDTAIPVLSYLFSDVVVYVDVVALHRRDNLDKLRQFVEAAHKKTKSAAWQPALILIQNKCSEDKGDFLRDETTGALVFNVTECKAYLKLLRDLRPFFCHVYILKMPSTGMGPQLFREAMDVLHKCLFFSAKFVESVRRNSFENSWYSESIWHKLVRKQVEHFNTELVDLDAKTYPGLPELYRSYLADIGQGDLEAARRAYEGTVGLTDTTDRIKAVLHRFACTTAGRYISAPGSCAVNESKDNALGITIVQDLEHNRRCNATDSGHQCVFTRGNHPRHSHKSNAMVSRERSNVFSRMWSSLVGGLFDEKVPHVWPGGFSESAVQYPDMSQLIQHYVGEGSRLEYFNRSPDESHLKTRNFNICNWCFGCGDNSMQRLDCPGQEHYLCGVCAESRSWNSGCENKIHCPYCRQLRNTFPNSTLPANVGHRLLSIDGGGVKGIAVILILKKIQETFPLLPLRSMFDLIIGTSIGGIISLGIYCGIDLDEIQRRIENLSTDILDSGWRFVKYFNTLRGVAQCDTEAFRSQLRELFGKAHLRMDTGYPRVFVTAHNQDSNETFLLGNYPDGFRFGFQEDEMFGTGRHSVRAARLYLADAAIATASAPIYFAPYRCGENCFVDGGMAFNANNPVKYGLDVVELERPHTVAMDGASISQERYLDFLLSLGCGAVPTTFRSSGEDTSVGAVLDKFLGNLFCGDSVWEDIDPRLKKSVNNIRINPPPSVGGLDPFSGTSIPLVKERMQEFFASVEGHEKMQYMLNMIYASLFCVRQDSNFVFGIDASLVLNLRDLRLPAGTNNNLAVPSTFNGRFFLHFPDSDVEDIDFSPDAIEHCRTVSISAETLGRLGEGNHKMCVYWGFEHRRASVTKFFQLHVSGSPFYRQIMPHHAAKAQKLDHGGELKTET